jgi:TM2 domain-containing membrane protein YozV
VVYYFVIATDGNRYGPADIDTLVQWTREGRIVGSTALVERGTERQVRADSITSIAVALQRRTGGEAGVAIERDLPVAQPEAPTVTRAPQMPPPPLPAARLAPLHEQRTASSPRSKVIAGLLGIFFGGLGAHRFYLGHTGMGVLMLLLSVIGGIVTLGVGCGLVSLWGFIEGVVCLCGGMNDAEGRPLRD